MSRGPHRRASSGRRQSTWSLRFARNVLLWLLPVVLIWLLITPFYNRFLTRSTENLVRLVESPAVTRLLVHDRHHFLITRTDVPASRGSLGSVNVSNTHFPLIMLGAFFLAVPGAGWRSRLGRLGWALLIAVFFHIISLCFWVQFIYATQLGSWSVEHYPTWQQNFWGLGKHLLDLPLKFALPVGLWAAFYLRHLMAQPASASPHLAVRKK